MSRWGCPLQGIGEHLRKQEEKRLTQWSLQETQEILSQPIGSLRPEKEPGGKYTGRRHMALSDKMGFSMKESELVTRYAGLQG